MVNLRLWEPIVLFTFYLLCDRDRVAKFDEP
jgi:hypothetical protein